MSKVSLAVPAANGQGAAQRWRGGWGTVWCAGTFDSGTITLQISYDGGASWQSATDDLRDDVTFSAAGHRQIAYSGRPLMRASLAGSGGATAVSLDVHYGVASVAHGQVNDP